MNYYYFVNTFDECFRPVQREGHIDATSEENAIQKLILDGVVYEKAFEFLELKVVEDYV